MVPWGIVGYTYCADLYCPDCIISVMPGGTGPADDTEALLDFIAPFFDVNREDEATFDSGTFPKVVLRDMLEGDEHCGNCHCELED